MVISNCTIHGHCWYSIGPDGLTAIEHPPTVNGLVNATDEAKRLYYTNIHMEIEALGLAKPQCDREIGEIPMPVSRMPASKEKETA